MKNDKVIIRCEKAGVHIGTLVSVKEMNGYYDVVLKDSRRIWSWAGANELYNLAKVGSKKPLECKISSILSKSRVMGIEILYLEKEAISNLEAIKEWEF